MHRQHDWDVGVIDSVIRIVVHLLEERLFLRILPFQLAHLTLFCKAQIARANNSEFIRTVHDNRVRDKGDIIILFCWHQNALVGQPDPWSMPAKRASTHRQVRTVILQ